MTEEAENVKLAKINRRAAKAALTRCGRALTHLVEHKPPASEVRDDLRWSYTLKTFFLLLYFFLNFFLNYY